MLASAANTEELSAAREEAEKSKNEAVQSLKRLREVEADSAEREAMAIKVKRERESRKRLRWCRW
jgi:hypothetical protein